ncbi:MAG: 6-phosphogluconate phosphatase [Aliivibrio sp.]|uniref:6-phosphogluconate phosphatase n=1 Tax=Aliivibrio sp. TaxID=1872443 RepID=UPI001A550DE7|nr:6-phosphogluconate phosphatase [Aliivibrio sp.]
MATANQISCIIFDCDGTLVDSEVLCCQGLVNVFDRFGATLSLEECKSHFSGGKIADILQAACKMAEVTISIDILEPLYREEVNTLFKAHLKPMPGVDELLHYLDDKQIEICVASNGPISKIEYALQLTGLLPQFKGKTFSAFDTNSWKPEPDLLRFAAMNMGVLVNECLFVDDTAIGVQAGINAGMKTLYFQQNPDAADITHPLVTRISTLQEVCNSV